MSLIIYYLYEDCVLQYFNFDPDKSLNHASTYHIVMVNQLYRLFLLLLLCQLWNKAMLIYKNLQLKISDEVLHPFMEVKACTTEVCNVISANA